MTERILTIGHSAHPIDEFVRLLTAHGVKQVVDVRTIAKSRHDPQFGEGELRLSGQVCKFVGDQAALGLALSGVWVCCRSSLSRRSARSVVVNFHLKGFAAAL